MTLRAGGGTRNALLQRRFRSATSCNSFHIGSDVALGKKCKYNCARISRLYLASDFRTNPTRPESLVITTPCDLKFRAPASAFAPVLKRLLFSTSDDVQLVWWSCLVVLRVYTSGDGIDGSRRCFLEYEHILHTNIQLY